MEIQSLSVVVPGKCVNDCAYCVSQMHESPYVNRVGKCPRMEDDVAEQDYIDRLAFARDNGCNVAVLTGACEPLQRMDFLRWFDRVNKGLPKPFRWLELQTTGVLLDDEKLTFLKQMGVKTIALSVAHLFDDETNCQIEGVNPKLAFRLDDLAAKIRAHNFGLRICVNLTNLYTAYLPESIFRRCKELGAHQVMLRQMFEGPGNTAKDEWIRQHTMSAAPTVLWNVATGERKGIGYALAHADEIDLRGGDFWLDFIGKRRDPGLTVWDLNQYIRHGRPLEPLPFGAMRYSVQGMSTVLDSDCMSEESETSVIRYLVLREDCHLYTKWDDQGSFLF